MAAGNRSDIIAVIPARYASERFPGKVLAPLCGKPMVAHVWERAQEARLITGAIVATDDERVRNALAPLGIPAVMTRPDHASGTDRVAEAARDCDAGIIVNIQGDEPLIDPLTIDATVRPLLEYPEIPMATARHRIDTPAEINDPNVVKVVCDHAGRALYFSRSPIPFVRAPATSDEAVHWQHVGIYAYRREFLWKFSALPPTPLEQLECLEQLRAVEHGYTIHVVQTNYRSIGVDTPEDLAKVSQMMEGSRIE